MLAIVISAAVSFALLGFAGAVIWAQVAGNWAAVRSALRGEPARADFAPAGDPVRVAVRPVVRRPATPLRRPPLALAA